MSLTFVWCWQAAVDNGAKVSNYTLEYDQVIQVLFPVGHINVLLYAAVLQSA